jgi:hypothetical protein
MKHLRQLCATAVLICAFAVSAYAGDIECDGFTAPSDYSVIEALVALVESALLLS